MNFLRRLSNSPRLNMMVGLILILVSWGEVAESLRDGFDIGDLNSHLGVTLMGLVNVIKALPDLFEGLEYVERARD